jgi:hypothetical protein
MPSPRCSFMSGKRNAMTLKEFHHWYNKNIRWLGTVNLAVQHKALQSDGSGEEKDAAPAGL